MTGLEPLLFGSAATATTGLFGSAGAFSLGTTLGTLGTGLSVLSGIQGMSAQSAAADYNANIAEANAINAQAQTDAEIRQAQRERALRTGRNTAAAGASGLGIGGSTLDVLLDNAGQEELNILAIEQSGLLKKQGFQANANLERMKGKSAQRAGMISTGAQILKTTGSLV